MRSALITLTALAAVTLLPAVASADGRFRGYDRGSRYDGHRHHRGGSFFGFSIGVGHRSSHYDFGYRRSYGSYGSHYRSYCPPPVVYAPPPVYYSPPVVYRAPVYHSPRVYYSAPARYYSTPCYTPPTSYHFRGSYYYGR